MNFGCYFRLDIFTKQSSRFVNGFTSTNLMVFFLLRLDCFGLNRFYYAIMDGWIVQMLGSLNKIEWENRTNSRER